MALRFFEQPIINSPYEYPNQHWELDSHGQPTQTIVKRRRSAEFVSPIPRPRRRRASDEADQLRLSVVEDAGLSTEEQEYDVNRTINEMRRLLNLWRAIPNPAHWGVTPETVRLLQHWRQHDFSGVRPFFCQIEAVETMIWLTEVAPHDKDGKLMLKRLQDANRDANPELLRFALKLATGAGKTTVMAMIIAWQTVNAVRSPNSKKFTRGFLVVTPGITIKDRLRVLQPNDPDSYYNNRELVPHDLLPDLNRAKIVITNYHAFKLRERLDLSKHTRALLQGHDEPLATLETEGQMIQRVMPELMNLNHVLVLNDEAHHCYREKPISEEAQLAGDERKEAERNNEAARLWIAGLEAVKRKIGIAHVIDLSATPFFLRGSGYPEGTLFHWTVSDFSLMDAIECGIVKLPRVPVSDNIPTAKVPMYRNLWDHIRTKMPKKGRGTAGELDPQDLPPQLQTALEALYGHYAATFAAWRNEDIAVPPCFIIVCNNTSTSKLVYDYVAGYQRTKPDGSTTFRQGQLELFSNIDANGNPIVPPRTLLIDSQQLESGEALDPTFRQAAADEIERFRRDIQERTGNHTLAEQVSDQDLLREVMNTVGKAGQLGGTIRCVVSVSMLTEGWDANTVTHVLGVRAFGTQLLCEQVVGRALRRQSYELNPDGLFNAEYADILGIPFDFAAEPVLAKVQKPRQSIHVRAVRPDRDHLEIRFPRVEGYRITVPQQRLHAEFTPDSTLELTQELIGATETRNAGIIGQEVDLTLAHTADVRPSQVIYELTSHLIAHQWRLEDGEPNIQLFGQMKTIVRDWINDYLVCKGKTFPAQLKYKTIADLASERITDAINRAMQRGADAPLITPAFDPFNPTGSTLHVSFSTTKQDLWQTDSRRCHVNWVVLDSGWEAEFCRVVEQHPLVHAYVKNHNLGFEVPYRYAGQNRHYRPDFILLVDDGHGADDLLHLVIEIKGLRSDDDKAKKQAIEDYWMPSINALGTYGRWAFAEFGDVYALEADLSAKITQMVDAMIDKVRK